MTVKTVVTEFVDRIVSLIESEALARTRAVVLGSRHWLTAFVYPALMAGFDTIVTAISPDGTAGSLAYSQMAALPVIQFAALAGAPGIVFIVSLFGTLAAIAWYCRTDIDKPWLAYGLPGALIVSVLAYGSVRLANSSAASAIPVGLIAIDQGAPAPLSSLGADDPVWTAYAAAALIFGGLVLRAILDYRAQRRALTHCTPPLARPSSSAESAPPGRPGSSSPRAETPTSSE